VLQGSSLQPIASQGDSVIKVKSLPYDACQLDVLMFFDGFKMRPNGVQLVIQGNNKPSGEVIFKMDWSETHSVQAESSQFVDANCNYSYH